MARVNWQGTEIQATLIDQLPNGNYRMKAHGRAPRVEIGTVIEVKQSEIVGLNIGGVAFNGPGTPAPAPSAAPPIILTKADVGPMAALQSSKTSTSVIPTVLAAVGAMPPPGPSAVGRFISLPSMLDSKPGAPVAVSPAAAPQPKGTAMGTPLVEIKGLGNAITSVRSGLAGVRALAADVQVSAGALHAELTDIKGQIEDARSQIKTEASTLGNSQGT